MHGIRLWFTGFVLVCTVMNTASASAEESTMELTLRDCIDRALRENLNFRASSLGLRVDNLSIVQAQSNFDPELSLDLNRRQSETPTFYQYYGVGSISSKTTELNLTLGQNLSTGAQWGFGFYNTLSESNIETSKNYTSVLGFNVNQPLLQGFGKKVARSQIYLARLTRESSEMELESTAVDLVSQVQNAYWNLVYAWKTLRVRELSVQQADSLLAYNMKGYELGVLTESDVLEAKSMLYSRRQEIIDQNNTIRNAEDVLRQLLNLTTAEDWQSRIIPVDEPRITGYTSNPEEALAVALELRPDYRAARKRMERYEFNRDVSKNSLLPKLNLNASYNVNGSGKTYTKNVGDIGNFDQYGWNVGLVLSYPLKNRNAEAEYEKREITIKQSELELRQLETKIDTEIRAAARNVAMLRERVDVAKMSVDVDDLKLKKEEERFRNKMSSSYYVLQYQKDLANSRNLYNKALIDYMTAVNELQRAGGILLRDMNISIIGLEN